MGLGAATRATQSRCSKINVRLGTDLVGCRTSWSLPFSRLAQIWVVKVRLRKRSLQRSTVINTGAKQCCPTIWRRRSVRCCLRPAVYGLCHCPSKIFVSACVWWVAGVARAVYPVTAGRNDEVLTAVTGDTAGGGGGSGEEKEEDGPGQRRWFGS